MLLSVAWAWGAAWGVTPSHCLTVCLCPLLWPRGRAALCCGRDPEGPGRVRDSGRARAHPASSGSPAMAGGSLALELQRWPCCAAPRLRLSSRCLQPVRRAGLPGQGREELGPAGGHPGLPWPRRQAAAPGPQGLLCRVGGPRLSRGVLRVEVNLAETRQAGGLASASRLMQPGRGRGAWARGDPSSRLGSAGTLRGGLCKAWTRGSELLPLRVLGFPGELWQLPDREQM